MDYKKLAISAAAFSIISQVVHTIGAVFSAGYYMDPQYFPVWSKLMMPGPSPPGAEFYIASLALGLVVGAIYTYAFQIAKVAFAVKAKKDFQGGNQDAMGLKFGTALFTLTAVPSFLSSMLLFSFSFGLQFSWLVEGFAICLLFGFALGRIYK